jgi:hypothetical protein
MNRRPSLRGVPARKTAARRPQAHRSNGWISNPALALDPEASDPWLPEGKAGLCIL